MSAFLFANEDIRRDRCEDPVRWQLTSVHLIPFPDEYGTKESMMAGSPCGKCSQCYLTLDNDTGSAQIEQIYFLSLLP